MKKIVFLLALAITATSMMAQRMERTNAYNYNRNGEYDKAREAIDKAIEHERTIGDATTWMYRGIIYLNIYLNEDFKHLDDQALEKANVSLKKAIELDDRDRLNQAVEILPRIQAIGQLYFEEAVEAFNISDYDGATDYFIKSFKVAEGIGMVDTLALVNAAMAAARGDLYQRSIDLYNQVLGIGVIEAEVYRNLAVAYRGLENREKMMEYIDKGRELFPTDPGLLLEEINAHLAVGEGDKVVDDLKLLVEQDPENYTIYFVLGTIYGDETNPNLFDVNVAENYYKEAIEIEPDYYDAIYNLGALYINESNKIQVVANDLPLNATKEYEKLTGEANVIIRRALPYLERAYEMNPDDKETVLVLRTIYARFNDKEKLDMLNKEE
jgi:tetratricopeptide (TPR) repeat protein